MIVNVGLKRTHLTLAQRVSSILRKYGTDAHVYLPGIGVINGLTAGNYLDSAGTTAATVDNPVGLVTDANGTINATQATTANKPILRRGAVNLLLNSATLSTQNVTTVAAPYTLSFTGTGSVKLSGTNTTLLSGTGANNRVSATFTPTAGTLTLTVTGSVTNAQLQVGTSPTTYIQTTTAPASSSTGNYWWQFDGTDFLSLGSVPFQMANDHCVIVGANPTKLDTRAVFGVGTGTARVCTIYLNDTWRLRYLDDAAVAYEIVSLSNAVTNTNYVVSGRKVANTRVLRVNGVQQSTDSTAIGTTTATVANIGAVSNGAAQFLGSIYPVIAIKGTVTDADLLTLEKFVGSLSGVTI